MKLLGQQQLFWQLKQLDTWLLSVGHVLVLLAHNVSVEQTESGSSDGAGDEDVLVQQNHP